jgi:predicted dehydrogenase
MQIHLYGSRGTVKVHFIDGQEHVFAGRAEDQQLTELAIPPEEQGAWTVEADFIAAIRGEKKVTRTSFADGVKYMEFLEAVARSAEDNAAVALPLD